MFVMPPFNNLIVNLSSTFIIFAFSAIMIFELFLFISSSLVLKPKKKLYTKYYKYIIFLFGFLTITLSQISFKFISHLKSSDLIIVSIPLLLVFFYYFYLILKTKSSFKTS